MTTRFRRRQARLAWEALGVLLSAVAGIVALAHALSGPKRSLILDDGDSVLLPLLLRSIERGEPFEWGLSPVLFAFPELPLYALSAAVTTSVAAALLLNGVLNVVLLYALLRWLAGEVGRMGRAGRAGLGHLAGPAQHPVLGALASVVVFLGLCLLETRPGGNTGEVASLYLTTTYYSGTLMAMLAALALAVRLTRARTASEATGESDRLRIRPGHLGLLLLAALATWSNPLFALWSVAPLGAGLLILAVLRVREQRSLGGAGRPAASLAQPAAALAALVVGAAIGYAARAPLSRFLIADRREYLRWGREDLTVSFVRATLGSLIETPTGVVEASAYAVLVVGTVALAVLGVRRGAGSWALVIVTAATAVIGIPVVLLVTGSISTRYALPLVFLPIAALACGVSGAGREGARGRATEPAQGRTRVRLRWPEAALAALVLAAAVVPSATTVVRSAVRPNVDGAACLSAWTDRAAAEAKASGRGGSDLFGAGQFWAIRGLQAFGGREVHLAQVNSDLTVYPWLTNLAPLETARVGYVVVATAPDASGHLDYWGDTVTSLGAPAAIVRCGRYDIYDFRGTQAADELTRRVNSSAEAQARLRGFLR